MSFSRLITGTGIVEKPLDDFPPLGFPVTYADAVLSAVRATPNVKFYLSRFDPHPFGEGGAVNTPTLQVIMPHEGFAGAAVFFAQTLALLVAEKKVDKKSLETILATCKEALEKHGAA